MKQRYIYTNATTTSTIGTFIPKCEIFHEFLGTVEVTQPDNE